MAMMLCCLAPAQAQNAEAAPAHIIAAAQRAFPKLETAQAWSHTLLTDVRTTALGCRPMKGLQLAQGIEVYSLPLDGMALHVSADGSMTQQCAQSASAADNGTGLIYSSISADSDRDGDGLPDSADACPSIAGITEAERPGCPQASRGDSDGDGKPNSADACPRQAGSAAADGCSLFVDEDGDGVPNTIDICPRDFGIIRSDFALGCPADGSGNSSQRPVNGEVCAFRGVGVPLYNGSSLAAAVIDTVDGADDGAGDGADDGTDEASAQIIGRDASGYWYQIQSGWLPGSAIELRGACYNLPLVNMASGAGSGCYLRPRANNVNVRLAPRGKQVARISPEYSFVVLGKNRADDWLFFRQGWVSRSVLDLVGDCSQLPTLDPAQVGSGAVHFCPPFYRGFLPPRIDVGPQLARVASETLANRLRAQPQLGAEQIGEIPPRQVLDAVLDGPACDGAFVWWQVEVDGIIGWTVESDLNANVYYLEPASANNEAAREPSSPTIAPPRAETATEPAMLISSANLDKLEETHRISVSKPLQVAWSPRAGTLALLLGSGDLAFYSQPDYAPTAVDLHLPAGFQAQAMAFAPDDSLAIGSQDGRVLLARLDASEPAPPAAALAPALSGPVTALDWSRDSRFLAAASAVQSSQLAGAAGELVLWQFDDGQASPGAARMFHFTLHIAFHFAFPYALSDVAFSEDGRWLAVTGESAASRRAALWIYEVASGRLAFSKALVGMNGAGLARATPSPDLADFIYSNGDSLYLLDMHSGQDRRFYHRAGALLPQLAIRRPVVAGAEILLAIAAQDANNQAPLHIVNAMNRDSPTARLPIATHDLAFSPDGRALALAQRARNRVMILSAAAS